MNKSYIALHMKSHYLQIIFFIGISLISTILYGQAATNEEENNLKFQTHFFEALKQKAIKNYGKAIEHLEKCYEIDSLSLAVEFEFSKNQLLLKKYNEAELFINKALLKQPENFHLLKHKVAIYKAQRFFKDAIEIQQKIINSKPREMDQLALLYIQNKEFKKAEKIIEEIEKNAFSTRRIKGFKKYLENRNTLIKTTTNNSILKLQNSDIETLRGDFKTKKEYKILQEIIEREAKYELFEAMYNDSKDGLELFPAQPYLYKMNGLALTKLGKYNEAINVLTLGIDFVIDNRSMEAAFYELLSESYKGLKQTKEALKYKQKAADLRNQQ